MIAPLSHAGATALIAILSFAGCASQQRTASSPTPASEKPDSEQADERCPPVPYVRAADPLFLAMENTSNVYERLTLAKLWSLIAEEEPDTPVRTSRARSAKHALAEANDAVNAQQDPCTAGVMQALNRAKVTKNNLEQRYLQVSGKAGEDTPEAKLLDAQVHLLRDEITSLHQLSAPCKSQRMFQ